MMSIIFGRSARPHFDIERGRAFMPWTYGVTVVRIVAWTFAICAGLAAVGFVLEGSSLFRYLAPLALILIAPVLLRIANYAVETTSVRVDERGIGTVVDWTPRYEAWSEVVEVVDLYERHVGIDADTDHPAHALSVLKRNGSVIQLPLPMLDERDQHPWFAVLEAIAKRHGILVTQDLGPYDTIPSAPRPSWPELRR